jgi:hypothetical protein
MTEARIDADKAQQNKKDYHKNTKDGKHEIWFSLFVPSYFRAFVMIFLFY